MPAARESERNAQESTKQKAKVNSAFNLPRLPAVQSLRRERPTPDARHPRAAAGDHHVDVWQTRIPWPATLPMAGSEQQDPDPAATAGAPRADAATLADRALVAATVAGDRAAFDVLVRRHQRTVYGICHRFAGDHAEASDLAQDAFVRAYRGLAGFKGDAAFGTWLYRVAVNVCLSRAAVRTPALDPIDPLDLADRQSVRPDEAVWRAQDAARVKAAIARLPEKQRLTVILRVYHDLPHEAIARTLGSTVGTVKANFFHALQNLRKLLGERAS